MRAGQSALRRSVERETEAEMLFELAREARSEAAAYRAACTSETALAGVLRALHTLGWVVLEDRLWPGSKRANVDFIAVGPGGVVVLDAKAWAEPRLEDGLLLRGDAPADEEVDKALRLVDSICDGIPDTGLTSASVTAALVFTGHDWPPTSVRGVTLVGDRGVVAWLTRLPARLSPDRVAEIAAEVAACCPEMPEEPVAPARRRGRKAASAVRAAVGALPVTPTLEQPSLLDDDALVESLMATAMAGPIEDWMTFLHPDQNKLVRAHWNGPARVRGAAGTGKTVVALHRGVYLAERSVDPVLVVSFVRTLPVVLASLAARLSPTAAANMEFTGAHKLAFRVLEASGTKIRLDARAADRAFEEAWLATPGRDRLCRIDERPAYWREEVDYVVKGRGLTRFEEYADLKRVGRQTPMRAEDRAVLWEVFTRYEELLEQRGIADFNDLMIEACDAVRRVPSLFRYSAVIVDEVQDLNLVSLQFLAELAGDAPYSLLVVGDGQQSVYPGGFTLSEAGINVTGRSRQLEVNYRNTVEILITAAKVVATDEYDDLDGLPVPGQRETRASRRGHHPLTVHASGQRDLERRLVDQLQRTRAALGTSWGDVAVLLERRRDVQRYRTLLERHGIPCVDLLDYDGTTVDQVKIGTVKRAKGLEFRYVLLPGLRKGDPRQIPGETDASYAERCARLRRELYVAMTRARDGLWLGYVGG